MSYHDNVIVAESDFATSKLRSGLVVSECVWRLIVLGLLLTDGRRYMALLHNWPVMLVVTEVGKAARQS